MFVIKYKRKDGMWKWEMTLTKMGMGIVLENLLEEGITEIQIEKIEN